MYLTLVQNMYFLKIGDIYIEKWRLLFAIEGKRGVRGAKAGAGGAGGAVGG